jgi:hypothetical protein
MSRAQNFTESDSDIFSLPLGFKLKQERSFFD